VALVYLCGVAIRILYTLGFQRPETMLYADMQLYVDRARRFAAGVPMDRADVTSGFGYPWMLAWLSPDGRTFVPAVIVQLIISCLLPLALGLLGAAAYGRRTALLAIVFGSLYYPFIEYGALFLTEIHFVFWLTLAFAGFLGARRAQTRGRGIACGVGGGIALSVAATFKTLALPAAFVYFVADGVAQALVRGGSAPSLSWPARLKPWVLRGAVAVLAAAPVLGVMSRSCTKASGHFCITGKEMGHDFLLGHYGRIADIEWNAGGGRDMYRFGSPSSHLRAYEQHVRVPFSIADAPANRAEAWRWVSAHPGEAIVLSLDHVYDTLFGPVMWPTMNNPKTWTLAAVSQFVFILFLFVPTVLALARVTRRGWRQTLTSRTFLVFTPIAALLLTVMLATGETRYRIPFDVFFIAIACAYLVSDLTRVDGPGRDAIIPSGTAAARSRS
jgi:4-amino-4-deoxy-L-arabinose transferase-like glycosyltransferase